VIIGVLTVAAMVSGSRNTVNPLAASGRLKTGIRTVYAVFESPPRKRQ
jgi:hypothetical protein